MATLVIENIEQINTVANQFIKSIGSHKIIAFIGKMGAGKTTFIKAICQKMGVTSDITSPTFSIVNEYRTNDNEVIFHFDLYRIKNIQELLDTGFEEYISSDSYIFIEWPEIAQSLLPEDTLKVTISDTNNKSRTIDFA